ncbi:Pycsar system effector family protein [Kitasatospora terrestris]|uniref:Pycsar effector protein domain-containing protein n=1 Tax=Kitasatospora terrestris TaxID=258051 RepID=A0ABP9DNR0_9ACTN
MGAKGAMNSDATTTAPAEIHQDRGSNGDALGAAWQIHGAVSELIGRVDSKASLALSLESAALVAITTLTQATGSHPRLQQTAATVAAWAGAVAIVTALVLAIAAVLPRTGSPVQPGDWRSNIVYFGHLRHGDAEQLVRELSEQDLLPALSRQLIELSHIAWAKHRCVRASLVLAGIGIVTATAPMMMETLG